MIHSFLIIGQSNMAGRGKLDEAQPLDNDKLLVLRNGRWQPMYRPVNNDRPFSGVCLAESFARLYADENNIMTELFPVLTATLHFTIGRRVLCFMIMQWNKHALHGALLKLPEFYGIRVRLIADRSAILFMKQIWRSL